MSLNINVIIAVILRLEQVLSQNGYGGIGNVALRAVHCIVIVVADSHRCGGWIKELGPIDAYSTRLTAFSEWCWIAIIAADCSLSVSYTHLTLPTNREV